MQQSQLLEGEDGHAHQPDDSGSVLPKQVPVVEEVLCIVHCGSGLVTTKKNKQGDFKVIKHVCII